MSKSVSRPSSQPAWSSTRALIASLTAIGTLVLLASPTLAQQRPGEQMGMRYLSWAGKAATPGSDGLRRPGDVTPRQQMAGLSPTAPSSGRPSRYGAPMGTNALTPASAWTRGPTAMPPTSSGQPYAPQQQAEPQPQPQYQSTISAPRPMPQQASQPMPQTQQMQQVASPQGQMTASAPEYDAGRSFRRQDPYYSAPPQVQAAMQPTPQPTYMPQPPAIPTAVDPSAPPAGYDPMAPRRDALIFQMGRPAETPAPQAQAEQPQSPSPQYAAQPQGQPSDQAAPHPLAESAPTRPGDPPREGARYYSVHREAGHEPDPMTLPESVFIGGATTDLAEPPAAPVIQRTINGRTQVVAPNQDAVLP